MYVYYFSQLLQENLVELDHGLAPHSLVEEEDCSITEQATADSTQADTAQADTVQADTVHANTAQTNNVKA